MKKLPLYFNSIATLPDKNCAVNISISYITLQNSRENLCKPATQKIKSNTNTVICGVLLTTALCTNIRLKPFMPLLNRRIDNVTVRVASELNQPLFQFINAMGVCLVNTNILHGHL